MFIFAHQKNAALSGEQQDAKKRLPVQYSVRKLYIPIWNHHCPGDEFQVIRHLLRSYFYIKELASDP